MVSWEFNGLPARAAFGHRKGVIAHSDGADSVPARGIGIGEWGVVCCEGFLEEAVGWKRVEAVEEHKGRGEPGAEVLFPGEHRADVLAGDPVFQAAAAGEAGRGARLAALEFDEDVGRLTWKRRGMRRRRGGDQEVKVLQRNRRGGSGGWEQCLPRLIDRDGRDPPAAELKLKGVFVGVVAEGR